MPADVDLLKNDVPAESSRETPWGIVRLSRQPCFRVVSAGCRHPAETGRLLYDVFVDYDTLEPDSDVHALIVDRLGAVTPSGWA
jgi:hypothetical protein